MWKTLFVSLALGSAAIAGPKVSIVIADQAPAIERAAAAQLVKDLATLFEAEASMQAAATSDAGSTILIGSPATNPAISKASWPAVSTQGQVLRSTSKGLIVGGGSPEATVWAVSELSYHFGMRHLLQGDALPIVKPVMKLDGLDVVLDSKVKVRTWQGFNGQPFGLDSWGGDEADRLLAQLAKLKFTHILLPEKITPLASLPVDGDSAGRTAFKGAKEFGNPDAAAVLQHLQSRAAELGLGVMHVVPEKSIVVALGAAEDSALPQFKLQQLAQSVAGLDRIVYRAVMTGDLDAPAHYVCRVAFDSKLTPEQALSDLVTPICGEGVAERLWKGFGEVEKAAALIAANDAKVGVPADGMFVRHLQSKTALPAWITEAKTLYTSAMSEMYRGNTRARGGARPFILYHAKRFEFAMHYFTALEALYKAHDAGVRADSLEAAVESSYNSLNAYADVARDASDRGVIAVLNKFGYQALQKVEP